jgi:hypothetical protein
MSTCHQGLGFGNTGIGTDYAQKLPEHENYWPCVEKSALFDAVLSPFRDTMPIPNASGLQPHMVNLNSDEELYRMLLVKIVWVQKFAIYP